LAIFVELSYYAGTHNTCSFSLESYPLSCIRNGDNPIQAKYQPFFKSLAYSLFGSFVIQPLSVFLGIYDHKIWQHYYSVPFFIVIYLIAHYLATRREFSPLDSKSEAANAKSNRQK
jgi:hypothetical protein